MAPIPIPRTLLAILLLCGTAPAQQYLISTLAGGAPPATPATALQAAIGVPNSVAVDASGNLYFTGNQCVFRVDSHGVLTRVAGNSRRGYSGDGGPAITAQLQAPFGVAVDSSGNIYIADELNQRIRKVLPNGIIVTVAGNGTAGLSGDGGAATSAQLNNPLNVLVDASGNLFIADSSNNRIRKVSPDGIITTIAGGGVSDPGDGGPAIGAVIANPTGMAIDASGNLYIADRERMRVRKVSMNGIITTVAGNGSSGYSGDDGPAVSAQLYLPTGVAIDSQGDLFIADFANNRVGEVSSSGTITTVPGLALSGPSGVAVDASGNLYVTDQGNHRVQRVAGGGAVSTVAGNGFESFSGDGGPATAAQLDLPNGVAADANGNVYISDWYNHRVRKVSPNGTIATVAGLNLVYPEGLAVDASGNLYVADTGGSTVYRVSSGGSVTTVAGNGTQGYSGDGGPALAARLNNPAALAVNSAGDLYIAEQGHVRKVSANGVITTLAGTAGLQFIGGLAADSAGYVYIATGSILKLSPGGVIFGEIPVPVSGPIALDSAGNIYTASGNTIVRISPAGTVTTIAGNGAAGYSGDGGPAIAGQLYIPGAVAVDLSGRVYVCDYANFAVRLLTPTNQQVIVSAVLDAASEMQNSISPGKIVAIYGIGLGPVNAAQSQPNSGSIPAQLAGTTVFVNGVPAPILYTSASQVTAVAPYSLTGNTAQVTVAYQGQTSSAFTAAAASSAPDLFTANGTGAGQAAAINVADGSVNGAAHPARPGDYISLYATGEGQTAPSGVDGKLASMPLPQPVLPVSVTVDGIPATVQYKGGAPGSVAGLMQVNVQIPGGVQPGGYVPVVLTVGNSSSAEGAVWISVGGN